jgi:hypothetical protein
MNEYIYGNAPVYKINDIPAYKAGEWPGIKSNKFDNTRRIIRAVERGIFFSEKEPVIKPRHKSFNQRYSQEYIFRPCLKKVKPIDSRTLHQLGEGIFPTPPEINCFIPKIYRFQKIDEYHMKKQEEHNKLLNENLIMNKNSNNLSSNNKTGFTKEFYENISNNKLLGITFTKELYYTYKNNNKQKKEINEFIKTNSDVRRHLENKRAINLKNEQENFQKDVDYVTSL